MPRNNVTVDIAPLNSAFETIAGNERMNIIMNHELVHLSTMDPPSSGDRAFRKLFGGKVMPVEEQPETILYFLFTTPRVAAPRWYHEGVAVFLDTWMAGGLDALRAGTMRWCSGRWSVTARRSTIRSDSYQRGPRLISSCRSIPISTARGS